MRFLRAILSGAFFLAYGAFALFFAPLLILPVWSKRVFRRTIRLFYQAFVLCARWTGLFRVDMDEATRKILASLHGVVVAMNHVSLIDIVVIIAHIPDATAIAKPAVLKNPFLAIVAKKMFIVNAGDASAVIDEAVRSLAAGVNVVIFPQGTRGGENFHRGAAHIALAAHAHIQPVRIDYDPPVLAKGQPWWDVGARTIRISLSARPLGGTRLSCLREWHACRALRSSSPHAAARALTERLRAALRP